MRLRLAPALLLLLVPTVLAAQGDIRLSLGGGITVPVRGYSDVVDRGWIGTGSLTYFPAATASLGLRLEGLYGRSTISIAEGKSSYLGGTANLVFQFGARRSPNRFYLFGGGGYVRTRMRGPNFGSLEDTSPALNGGAGFSFGGRGFALFAEARYLNVYTDGSKPQFTPLTAGISFGGL